MNRTNWERWGAASGYLILALGIAAAAFERGSPPANAPLGATLAYFTQYRNELLIQSLLFVLSAGVYLWFFGSLSSFLLRTEGVTGRLSNVAFGAGVIWAGIQMVFQGGQVALAMGATADVDPALVGMMSDMMYALSVIAYVPLAIMLTAVALVSLRTGAFPAWVGWLSAGAAATNLLLSLGIAVESGPLVPGGGLTYVLYALMAVWLMVVTTVMVVRLGRPASARVVRSRAG
jgi:hypothetical protein